MFRSHLGPRRPTVAARRPRSRSGRPVLEALEPRTLLAVLSVINTNDTGAGSLRQAILTSNGSGSVVDTIDFAIPGTGIQTITPQSPLPAITNPVVVDGTSQPGYTGTPLIELDGSFAASQNPVPGLLVSAGGSTIKGLNIEQFTGAGIVLQTNGGNVVQSCFIGTNSAGTGPLANGGDGITISSSPNNTIGGSLAGQRNLLSGNTGFGIQITNFNISTPPTHNVVIGNLIGTDITGSQKVPNNRGGVTLTFSAADNTIGGTIPGDRNVISGNKGDGIDTGLGANRSVIQGNYIGTDAAGTRGLGNTGSGINDGLGIVSTQIGGATNGAGNLISGNGQQGIVTGGTNPVIEGNFIGTDFTATTAIGNASDGIFLFGATNATVGGGSAGDGNVISANVGNGINTLVAGSGGSVIQGNLIGTDITGTLALGNVGHGIDLFSSNNTVGGASPGQGNIIANTATATLQSGAGVAVILNSNHNTIVGNLIYNNQGLGIDLGDSGVPTQNAAGGHTTGPNNLQNYPVLNSAIVSNAGGTQVKGSLNSGPNTTFALDFYGDPAADASGHGQGQTYLGRTMVTTDNKGNVSFSANLPGTAVVDQVVTATATDPLGDTSEFSADQTVLGAQTDVSVTIGAAPSPVLVGQNLVYTLTVTNSGPNDAFGVTVQDTLPANLNFLTAGTSQGSVTVGAGSVTGNLGTILVGQSATVSITVIPAAAAVGQVTDTATVTATKNLQPNLGSNTASLITTVNPTSDLSVTVSGSPNPVLAGQPVTYTVIVTDNGPNTATGVNITDTLPANSTFSSATISKGTFFQVGNTVVGAVGNLAVGGSATFKITVIPSGLAVGTVTDTATALGVEGDPNTANNTASATTIVNPAANLVVTVSGSPNPVLVGQTLTYTVRVTNNGPNTATNLTVPDTIPSNVVLNSATPSQGTVSQFGSKLIANLGSLASGSSATVTIIVTPTSAAIGSILDAVTASATEGDPNIANNSASVITTVNPASDLSVTIAPSPDPVLTGQNLTYILSVTNAGPSAAGGVVVTDTLPANVAFVSVVSSQGIPTQSGSQINASLGTLAAGSTATVTIVVQPNALAVGQITDQAHVQGNQADPNPANNDTSVTTTVNPSSDLSIALSGSPDPVPAGQDFTYVVTVTNNGPNTAANINVTDNLPANVNFVSAMPSSGTASQAGGVVTGTIASLAVGSSATITILVQPSAAAVGTITDTANVSASTVDPNAGNNDATLTSTVGAAADLGITMSASANSVFAGGVLTYTLTVSNSGPNQADNVVVSDTLPLQSSFTSASASQGTATQFGGQVQANLGSIAVGGSATITVVIQPTGAAAVAGSMTNVASVSSSEIDVNSANDSASNTTTVNPSSDLSVSIASSPRPVLINGLLSYTVTVTNFGPNDATGVTVVDTIPVGTTLASQPTTSLGTVPAFHPGDTQVTASLGTVPFGSVATITIVVTAPGTVATVTDQATVSSPVFDPVSADNKASLDTAVVLPTSDLQVTVTPAPSPVFIGQNLSFTVNVVNNGPEPASAVVLTVPLPSGATFVSAAVSGANPNNYQNNGTNLTFNVGALPVGSLATMTVQLTASALGSLTQSGSVTGAVIDPNSANNAVSAIAQVLPATSLSVSQTASPTGSLTPGQTLTYTITVTNNGPLNSTNTVLTDTLPPGAVVVSESPGTTFAQVGQVLSANLGTISTGTLGTNGTRTGNTATVQIAVALTNVGLATNTVGVSSDLPNPAGQPSVSVLSVPVLPVPGTLQFAVSAYSVNETDGLATISVARIGGSGGVVSVPYTTFDGNAIAGIDYTHESGTLTFNPGQVTQSFTVPILDAHKVGGTSAFAVSLGNPAGGASLGAPSAALVTINDNDQAVIVTPPLKSDGPRIVKLQRFGTGRQPTQIVLTFDGPLNAQTAENLSNYLLTGPVKSLTKLGPGIRLISATYNPNTLTVTLRTAKPIPFRPLYQLTVNGSSPTGVSNRAGQLLDGLSIGKPGSNFVAFVNASDTVFSVAKATPKGPAHIMALGRPARHSAHR
jgi:uncharacterized repeat protein (TIGR01451 family)